jgi:hypothetical protein
MSTALTLGLGAVLTGMLVTLYRRRSIDGTPRDVGFLRNCREMHERARREPCLIAAGDSASLRCLTAAAGSRHPWRFVAP